MRRLIKMGLFALALYGVTQFCHQETEGFALTKVSTLLLEKEVSSFDNTLLNQPYHYLAKGGQSYVFVSEDGLTILKLFRSSKLSTLQLLHSAFPLHRFKRKIAKLEKDLEQTLQSYELAKMHLKEETGILDLHCHPTKDLPKRLVIIDKLKIAHTIDPNLYPFVVQKRALSVKTHIDQLMQNQDLEKAKAALTNLFALLETPLKLGIEDGDPNLSKNFGFIDDYPVEIDGGRFTITDTPSLKKIADSKEDMQHWLNKYHPELSFEFDNAYRRMIERYEAL